MSDTAPLRLRSLVPAGEILSFTREGTPVSKQRPRVVPGRTYTPAKTARAERALKYEFLRVTRGGTLPGHVAIVCIFYLPDFRVRDIDNLTKLVLDAGNAAKVWRDDSWVTVQASFLELDASNPRTEIAFCPVTGSFNRTTVKGRK